MANDSFNIMLKSFAAGAVIFAATAQSALASAYEPLPGGNGIRIKGTGYNISNPLPPNSQIPTSTGVDPNWTIKAFANNIILSPEMYIPTSIPTQWYGGSASNDAISFPGDPNTYRWATYAAYPNSLNIPIGNPPFEGFTSDSYFQRPFINPQNTDVTRDPYSYIVSAKFTLSKSARYDFAYNTTADNRVQLYLGGTVMGLGTQLPGITGGTLIAENAANTPGQFASLVSGTKTMYLNAGEYELNYVITDNWRVNPNSIPPNPGTFGQTGILIGASTFTEVTSAVPAPLPIFGAFAFFSYSRKLRSRASKLPN
jgi:hypothetical protein